MHAIVHPADIQDRDGGVLLISTLFGLYPFLRKIFADGGYQGPVFEQATAIFLVIVHTHPIAAGGADAGGTATAKGRRVDEFRIFGLRIGGKAILPLVCRTDSRTI